MGISGSQKALMFALGAVMRGGASRGGYIASDVYMTIGGIQVGTIRDDPRIGVVIDSLTITDVLDETPNTASFKLMSPVPTWTGGTGAPALGTEVVITIGSKNNATREFAGVVLSTDAGYDGKPVPTQAHAIVHAIDYTHLLNRRKASNLHRGQSASAIAIDIITRFTAGFTTAHVQAALPIVDEISFTNQTVSGALTQLAKRVGAYWYVDYHKDLHFYTEEPGTDPQPLTLAHRSLAEVSVSTDDSQVVTRVYVEGGGVNALTEVPAGNRVLPVQDAAWYDAAGGVVAVGTQRLTYTGKRAGGGGTVVGTGAQPNAAPTAGLALGSELGVGVYQYAYTFVTASGESKPGPLASILTTPNQPDPVLIGAPVGDAGSPYDGGGIAGYLSYKYTFYRTSDGRETAPTPASPVLFASHNYRVNLPLAACETPPAGFTRRWYRGTGMTPPRAMAVYAGTPNAPNNNLFPPGPYYWAVTFVTATGETSAGSTFGTAIGGPTAMKFFDVPTGPSGTIARKIYRTATGGAGGLKLVGTIADNTTIEFLDTVPDSGLGALVPAVNTAVIASSFKLLPASQGTGGANNWGELSGNLIDVVPDGALGAAPPATTQFTGNGQRVSLTDVSKGPTGVTARKVYRTTVGGAQLKLVGAIADNTTTSTTDATADGALGANAPTLDTSALSQPSGQVLPGETVITIAATAGFSADGGWAVIGNGQQVIKYSGISGLTLYGIPPSGHGAITAAVGFGSSITDAPVLLGLPVAEFEGFPIPAGGIVRPVLDGDAVNLLVQLDDTVAQARVAASAGGDGIIEEYLQDNRLGKTEALSRARAKLLQQSAPIETITYRCRDRASRAGRSVTATLDVPRVNGQFKIQQVTISNFGPNVMPTYAVTASSARFSFEDLLRLVRGI